MCGFVGFINNDNVTDPLSVIDNMSQAIIPRGPDDYGKWSCSNNRILFGFRRLSILDLTHHGHQPMISKSKRFVICFNGEIYNHQSLRQEILKSNSNFKFIGNSDNFETLLAAIEEYGLKNALQNVLGCLQSHYLIGEIESYI